MRVLNKLLISSIILLSACSNGTVTNEDNKQDEFNKFANEFYTQMMVDGEITESVKDMHKDFSKDFSNYKEDDLYVNLDNMYKALGNEGESATPYQLEVMRIINDK